MRRRRTLTAGLLGALALSVATVAPAGAVDRVDRLAGPDRYATAVTVSTLFPAGVPVVFLATGENFPDALAAGPAAALAGGPVLLTGRDSLPEPVHGALARLDPVNIVVLGSESVISANVALQASNYASGTVVRVSGGDRYETAANIAANFPAPADVVYVASGLGFADALAASAAAGSFGGPLLLTDPNGIPASTAAQLDRLNPGVIVVAGGPSSVSVAVEEQLAALYGPVVREAGPDRYATSAAISANSFVAPASTVFLATGSNFPDALAGGPLAGITVAPVLLVRQDCVPRVVMTEIQRLQPSQVVLLGGESVLGPTVAGLSTCADEGGLPRTG